MPSNTQGEQYLDLMFADNKGYVAVAAKNGQAGAWSEQVFSWPHDRELIMSWAEANRAGDVFICPALRRTKAREKNDGAHLGWLWADVDWQDVPEADRARVRKRIDQMATFTVASGSGDNVHVYTRLDKIYPLELWRRLNAGMRAYLSADAKHTDNALLRLPGTINHKPGGGRVVLKREGIVTSASAAKLLQHQAWRDVPAITDRGVNDGAYDTVDVSGLLRGEIKRRVQMDADEAIGRYGTRHGAVYQVTQWLSRKGLTADQIHSLMAEFPAGVSKEDDERGYSLHVDIARCLGANPTIESLDVVDDVFEILDADAEVSIEDDGGLLNAARKKMRQMDVDQLARQMHAQRMFTPPPDDVSYTWAERRAMDRPPVQYAVEHIAAIGQNVTITGQYKAGKTLLALNLVRSLVDGEPFLNEFKIDGGGVGSGRLGLWSLEMNMTDLDTYIDPLGISDEGAGRLAVLNGRGYGVNILTDVGKQWAINWLKSRGCVRWVIDSHARLCRMAGVEENDNGPVLGLLHRLDEIKEEAGIGELFYLAHTGRGENGSGETGGIARARGATVLDDWADARWVLTREAEIRFLSVEGRGVRDMTATSLEFDPETSRLALGSRNKYGARVDGLVAVVTAIVEEQPGELNMRALRKLVRERAEGAAAGAIAEAITEAIDTGFIKEERVSGREKRYWGGEGKVFDFSRAGSGPKRRKKRRTDDDDE